MPRMYHVTSSLNRASIRAHGLDVSWMQAACGIAGSPVPEEAGVFLCEEESTTFFVRMNAPGGFLDIWAVDDIDEHEMVDTDSGFSFLPGTIPVVSLTLWRSDLAPGPDEWFAASKEDRRRSTDL